MVKQYFKTLLQNNPLVLPAVILAGILYAGVFHIDCEKHYNAVVPPQNVSRIAGTVVSTPMRGAGNSYRVKVKLNSVLSSDGMSCDASGEVLVFIPASLYEIYSPGKLYSLWRGNKNFSLIDSGAQIEFDVVPKAKKNSAAQEIEFAVAAVNSCAWENGNSVFERLKKIRALCRLHFSRLMYAWGNAGGLVLALLSGSREYLDEGIGDAFRNAGLSHVLALSGMHLSLFSGLAFFLGKKSIGKKLAHIFELVAVLLFFWFAGKSPSLFRALLCSLCLIGGAAFHIKIKSMLNVLALCFVIHVAIFPADMFELSFMLSYGALAGILCFNEFITKPLSRALPYGLGSSLGQSTGAQIFSAPICLRFFGTLTPGGIVSGAVISPVVTVFVYIALALIVLCLACPFLAPLCGKVLGVFYAVLTKCVMWFAGIPQIRI